MKKLNYILCFIFVMLLSSCEEDKAFKVDTIETEVAITHVGVYKYSKIQGCINYHGIILDVDNGNSGYYYKHYNLKPGNRVKRIVRVYYHLYQDNNPYKNAIVLSTGEVNFRDYEINK